MKKISVVVSLPLQDLIDAVAPEVSKSLQTAGIGFRIPKYRPTPRSVSAAVDRVIAALDEFDQATHTINEGPARERLVRAARSLRLARANIRSK